LKSKTIYSRSSIPGVWNIPVDAFSRLIPHFESKVKPQLFFALSNKRSKIEIDIKKQLKALIKPHLRPPSTREPIFSPFIPVHVQPSYSEARHKELAMHHDSLGHFGVDKILVSARASELMGI
jgi:hypothetical protein